MATTTAGVAGISSAHPTQPEVLAAYTDGLANGRLFLPYCEPCGRFLHHWFSHCSKHWSVPVEVKEATGTGTVWSWVRYHRQYRLPSNQLAPYFVLCLDLDDGPRTYASLGNEASLVPVRGMRASLNHEATSANGHLVFDCVGCEDSIS